MSQPTSYGGRPMMPAPGVPQAPERRVARLRRHGRALVWPAIVLVVVAAATGWLWDNLPVPVGNAVLVAAASVVVLLLCLLPFLAWLSTTWTITTRRVIERSGLVASRRREFFHARGYTVGERRGLVQRMFRTGTLTLSNGLERPMVLRDIAAPGLVHEVLADQVEVGQMMAHRDAQATSALTLPDGMTQAVPPRPPLPPAR